MRKNDEIVSGEGGIKSLRGHVSKTTTHLAPRACKIGLFIVN
nr:MAG TPA: hypothetical protein [Caudoviricetes sp.]DAL15014.1 MAG TPA_asm: hypothetical protein [Caudoviricetes sp.]